MGIARFCVCGSILELVKHTAVSGDVYWQLECPEGDFIEVVEAPEEGSPAAREVVDAAV